MRVNTLIILVENKDNLHLVRSQTTPIEDYIVKVFFYQGNNRRRRRYSEHIQLLLLLSFTKAI